MINFAELLEIIGGVTMMFGVVGLSCLIGCVAGKDITYSAKDAERLAKYAA